MGGSRSHSEFKFGWVVGVSSIQFFLDFSIFFNFANNNNNNNNKSIYIAANQSRLLSGALQNMAN